MANTRLTLLKERFGTLQTDIDLNLQTITNGQVLPVDCRARFNSDKVLIDWNRRDLAEFSFNGSPAFNPEEIPDCTDLTCKHIDTAVDTKLKEIHPALKTYIKEFAHQYGFLNTSNRATSDYYMEDEKNKFGRILKSDKGQAIFIENGDGNLIFIEIVSIDKLVDPKCKKDIESTQPGRPLAVTITTSLITVEGQLVNENDAKNVPIKHELKHDKILLLDPVAKAWINKNDTMELVDCCKLTDDHVQRLIDIDINKQLLKREIKLLNNATSSINQQDSYQIAARNIAVKSKELYNKNMIQDDELTDVISFCKTTRAVVQNQNEATINQFTSEAQQITTKRNTPYASMVRATLLGLLGATLFAASIAVTVASFGSLGPIGVAGVILATQSVAAAGAAIGYSVFSAGIAAVGVMTFYKALRQPQIADLAKGTELLSSIKNSV